MATLGDGGDLEGDGLVAAEGCDDTGASGDEGCDTAAPPADPGGFAWVCGPPVSPGGAWILVGAWLALGRRRSR